jgi:hypothetical protein
MIPNSSVEGTSRELCGQKPQRCLTAKRGQKPCSGDSNSQKIDMAKSKLSLYTCEQGLATHELFERLEAIIQEIPRERFNSRQG